MRRSFATAASVEQDTRSLAQQAADKAGLRMEDWLRSVLEDCAASRGINIQDLSEEERAQAVFHRMMEMRDEKPAAANPSSKIVPVPLSPASAPPQPEGHSLNDLLQSLADRVGTFKETPPQLGAKASLQEQLQGLSKRVETAAAPQKPQADRHVENALNRVEALRDLNTKTDEIRELVSTLAQRPSSAAKIERHLELVASRIDALSQQTPSAQDIKDLSLGLIELRNVVQRSSNPALMDALEHRIEELNSRLNTALIKLDPTQRFDDLTRRIETVNRRLETSLGEMETTHLQEMMQEVIAKLDRPRPGESVQLANMENELRRLAARVEGAAEAPQDMITILRKDLAGLHRRLDILSENSQDTTAIRHLNMRVTQLSDQIETLQRDPKSFVGLEGVISQLQDKIESFSKADRDHDLVAKLRDEVLRLTQRIDANPPENLGPALKMLEEVEHHLEKLSQNAPSREDRARLNGLELSVRDLHKQVIELRQNITNGIGQSAQALSRSFDTASTSAIESQLQDLRQNQEKADKKTAETLTSINQVMQDVVQRLATLENEEDELRPAPHKGHVAAQAQHDFSRLDISADDLLAPGQGRPTQQPEQSLEPTAASASQASFIAAARRAARAAQEAAERAAQEDAKTRRAKLKLDFFATVMRKQRKRLLVALATVAVAIGAIQALRFLPDSKEVAKVATAPSKAAPTKQVAAVQDKAMLSNQPVATIGDMVNASPISAVKAAAVDPALVGGGTSNFAPRVRVSEAAAKGDAAAQFELGMRYAEGRGMPQDHQQAISWLNKAAQQNLAPAQFRIGSMYERGLGTGKDLKRAREFYMKAAAQGHARATHNLGVLFAEGAEGKPDYATALTWFKKAAELGVRDSQFNLAILYARGMGTEQNLVQGWIWFNAATMQGDMDAGRKRDELATRMTATQIAAAKAQADNLKIRKPDMAANEVPPPLGGWDDVPEVSVQSKPPATPAGSTARVSRL